MLCADAAEGELGLRGHGTLAAVVPHPGDVLLLRESGKRSPLIYSHSLFFQTSQRKQNTKVTVTGVAQPTHSRAAFACSTQLTAAARRTCVAPRAPDAAAPVTRLPPSGGEQACLRASGM